MKKILSAIFCLTLTLALVSCAGAPALAPTQSETNSKLPDTSPITNPITTEGNEDPATQEQTLPQLTTEEDNSPKFESEELSIYADQFKGEIKKLHKAKNGVIYVETTDGGFYHAGDTEKENNLLADKDLASWEYLEFAGLITVDSNGYYTIDDHIAHGINGEILYAFYSGKLYVYSVDADGYVYMNSFESTGKKADDNVKLSFEEKSQDGYSFTHLGVYDKVEEIRVLPAKGNYITSPNVYLRVNGKSYVNSIFLLIVQNQISLVTNSALSEDESKNFLDYYAYETTYFKDGVNDKLFYMYDGDEYVLNLPDSHTVDEIKYFNRGNNDMLLFSNGDVYIWQGEASILGENAVKHEELSKIGTEIQEVIFCNNVYRVLMSDGVIYTINSTSNY